jgi:hypothetical protein
MIGGLVFDFEKAMFGSGARVRRKLGKIIIIA